MTVLRQFKEPDCSLLSAINCGLINWGLNSARYTQDYCNRLMTEYIAKHPSNAVEFLNERGEKLKIVPIGIREARILLKARKAIVVFLHYTKEWWFELADDMIQTWRPKQTIDSKKPHYFCLKGEKNGKVFVYDSNLPKPYEIETWERFVQEGVIGKTFYVIK